MAARQFPVPIDESARGVRRALRAVARVEARLPEFGHRPRGERLRTLATSAADFLDAHVDGCVPPFEMEVHFLCRLGASAQRLRKRPGFDAILQSLLAHDRRNRTEDFDHDEFLLFVAAQLVESGLSRLRPVAGEHLCDLENGDVYVEIMRRSVRSGRPPDGKWFHRRIKKARAQAANGRGKPWVVALEFDGVAELTQQDFRAQEAVVQRWLRRPDGPVAVLLLSAWRSGVRSGLVWRTALPESARKALCRAFRFQTVVGDESIGHINMPTW